MAIDGKSVNSMPSDIRRDMELRQYFQQGWEQAVEDVTLAQEQQQKPDWRHRFVWIAIMITGGLATASHLINNVEQEKAEQQAILSGQKESQSSAQSQPVESIGSDNTQLSLLTENQRSDLQLQAPPKTEVLPLEPVIDSTIQIEHAVISKDVIEREPVDIFTDNVPKYIRELYFFTEISHANGQTIYHRWRNEHEILATIKLEIKSDKYRTWSSKKLASAWQGKWYLEVLNTDKQVIYRDAFNYGN